MQSVETKGGEVKRRDMLRRVLSAVAPWIVGVLCFCAIDYHFYAPQIDGRSLSQGDIAQYFCVRHAAGVVRCEPRGAH